MPDLAADEQIEYDRVTFFPSNRKEKVRNWPGRALSFRPSGTTKRNVLASDACCVMLANFRISAPSNGEGSAGTPRAGSAGVSDLVLTGGAFEGRRITRA